MENASEAKAVVEAAKEDGLALAPEMKEKGVVTLLEGDVEQAYYVSTQSVYKSYIQSTLQQGARFKIFKSLSEKASFTDRSYAKMSVDGLALYREGLSRCNVLVLVLDGPWRLSVTKVKSLVNPRICSYVRAALVSD